jgi:hypothetical protein
VTKLVVEDDVAHENIFLWFACAAPTNTQGKKKKIKARPNHCYVEMQYKSYVAAHRLDTTLRLSRGVTTGSLRPSSSNKG